MNQATLLSGKTILITRPLGRENHLRQLIEHAAGTVIHYPVFKIQAPSDIEIEQLLHLRDQLHSFSMAIFVSATAVERSQTYFPALPEHLTIVSIGSKTSHALGLQNIHTDIEAPDHNTESLLQRPELQSPKIQGHRILIFRGDGGRALLGDTLVRRGAQVRYVETYHRQIPALPPLTEQQISSLDAVTISSNEGLDNLITLMEDPSLLIDVPLIVPGERTLSLARQHGFKTIVSASNATDEAIFQALTNHI
ncbi:MAG: hypothetical protein GQ572_05615 [Gammaproteobacteria bacterium]|jgi:uroporphyrinogen-III synthase|nr:hypothetical protein [Gammaproteobacteria bacterium]